MISPRAVCNLFETENLPQEKLFDPVWEERLLDSPKVQGLLSEVSDSAEIGGTELLLFTLRALAIQRAHLSRRLVDADLVGTLPGGAGLGMRATRMVVREMVAEAEREVVVLGFEVSDEDFLRSLSEVDPSVTVLLVVDRERGSAREILAAWPEALTLPDVFRNRPDQGDHPFEKMHSKAVVVDGQDLLITSANLTSHGLGGNFELGVRLQGEPAEKARNLVARLLESDLMERYEG